MDELTVLFEGSRLDLHLTRDTTVITTGSIAILSLSNKEKAVNTLDTDFQPEAKECLQLLKSQSPSLGLLVICSRLPASFLHGGDVKLQSTFTRTAEARAGIEELKALLQAIEDLPFPTVALLHATTLGGGLEVALACDYRFAAPDCKAIGLPELRLGVLPGAGGCVRLPRLIGLQPAVELILGSKVINATAAAALGVVNDVLPLPVWGVGQSSPPWWPALASKLKTLKPSALGVRKYPFHFRGHTWLEKKLLQTLVLRKIELATKNLYPAPRTCLDVLLRAWQADYQEAMGIETEGYLQLCLTTEAKALMSLFLNKSVLKHEASSLLGAPSSTPLHVLVLGSGWMGTGIGHQLALNGARVTLYDVATEALVTAKHRVGLLNETMVLHLLSKTASSLMRVLIRSAIANSTQQQQQSWPLACPTQPPKTLPRSKLMLKQKVNCLSFWKQPQSVWTSSSSSLPR
jgi:3-hydroxyacyl-CoA dehydrogenase/enoyl-CoA hydratase/3-hydroxybutyryl-CoA epimerase